MPGQDRNHTAELVGGKPGHDRAGLADEDRPGTGGGILDEGDDACGHHGPLTQGDTDPRADADGAEGQTLCLSS